MNHKYSSLSRDYGMALTKIKQLEAMVKDIDNQAQRNSSLQDRLAQRDLEHQRNKRDTESAKDANRNKDDIIDSLEKRLE